ncbi:MAG: SIMPL domain-containing protein [Solirubrobacteraceae bacterium]|nr:SIMPL domain-containing protein [Solirubrobacteraceae bacterium]
MRRRLAIAAVLAALPAGAAPAVAQDAPPASAAGAPTLTVLGQGTAFATPDTAGVSAAVTRTAARAATAREDVARRTAGLLRALDALGVPRADITTSSVTLSRSRHRRPPRVRYAATVSIAVHLTDARLAGPVLDALVAARADEVAGPDFGFSDPSAGRAEAERAAIADARARADSAAAALGLRVLGVRAVDLDPGASGSPAATDAAAPAPREGASPTPVQAGRRAVSATVAVVFVLG